MSMRGALQTNGAQNLLKCNEYALIWLADDAVTESSRDELDHTDDDVKLVDYSKWALVGSTKAYGTMNCGGGGEEWMRGCANTLVPLFFRTTAYP